MINISDRLFSIVSLIEDGEKVVDIGCDHGLLDVYLTLYKKCKCTAYDVNSKIIERAKTNFLKYNVFDKVDKDKNGYVEKGEIANLIQELINKLKKDTKVPEDKVQTALKLIDTDGDGRISKEEFRKTSRTKLLTIIAL